MLICQTPLRISFAGGGTDFKGYYETNPGLVLSTTIDKYVYVMVKKRFDDKIVAHYKETEVVDNPEKLKHNLIREALRFIKIKKQIEVTTIADVPATGTGLGSSGSLIVGLLHILYAYKGELPTKEQLAREACEIEINKLHSPIGKQDQYAAAYGGLNLIGFLPKNEEVIVDRLELAEQTLINLEQNLILFYTGIARNSSSILSKQKKNIKSRLGILDKMWEVTDKMSLALEKGKLLRFGELLDEDWQLKKRMEDSITNPTIDTIYEAGKKAGAVGGKITGAGGGGFILFYCPVEKQPQVRKALKNLRELPFHFDKNGSQVIFNRC